MGLQRIGHRLRDLTLGYSTQQGFHLEGERKKFSDKQILEEYRNTEPILKEKLKLLLYIEKEQESLRKGKSQ